MKKNFLVCTLTFIASAILGWTISTAIRPDSRANREVLATSATGPVRTAEGEKLFVIQEEMPTRKEGAEIPLRDRLRGSGMRSVPESALANMRVNVLHFDGTLSADVIGFFSLTSEEVSRLNQALSDTRKLLNQLELDRLEVVRSTSDELVLHLPAYEEEGLAAEAALKASIDRELGDADGKLLWNFMEESADRPGADHWNGFGRIPREISFRLGPGSQDPDRIVLHFSNEPPKEERSKWLDSEGRKLRGRSIELYRIPSTEWVTRAFGRYEYLLPLLPERLTSFLTPPGEQE